MRKTENHYDKQLLLRIRHNGQDWRNQELSLLKVIKGCACNAMAYANSGDQMR
jgi:hypothetical protein